MKRSRVAAVLGVLLLTVPACSTVDGAMQGSLPGADTMTVTAYFSDTAGLFRGNSVGILGVDVGRVTEIEPEGERVKVTLEDSTTYPPRLQPWSSPDRSQPTGTSS